MILGMPTRRQLELLDDNECPASLPRLPMARGILGDGNASSSSFSVDHSRTHRPAPRQPETPASRKERAGSTSVRSILREPNTPGTGQSVRFFSRDAFKVISPRASTASSPANSPYPIQDFELPEPDELEEDGPEFQSGDKSEERSRSTSLVLADEGQSTNLFDMSLDMPPIPPPQDASNMLSDDAVEVPELPSRDSTQDESLKQGSVRADVDQSSFMPAPPGMLPKTPVKSRSPEPEASSVADTTSYWTARSLFPFFRSSSSSPTSTSPNAPTKSHINFNIHLELIAALREELDLQKKMNKQIELDLDNRDQLVEILCMRVETAEDELEEWRTDGKEQNKVVGTLKKQLISLEKMCTKLQGMDLCVDTRDESIRSVSVSDEASAQALKTLKERIRSLEEEKRDLSKDAGNAREELAVLRERLKNGEDDNSDIVGLIDERNELREQIAALEEVDGLQRQEIEELQRKLRETVNGTCF
jgi:hypothetical protein